MKHEVTIDELDDGSWDATCTCGWEDPGYEEWEDAKAAGDEHLRNPED